MQLIVTHLSKSARAIQDVDFTRPTAVVFGNETFGVRVLPWRLLAVRPCCCPATCSGCARHLLAAAGVRGDGGRRRLGQLRHHPHGELGVAAGRRSRARVARVQAAARWRFRVFAQAGFVESFNISVAASLVMFEAQQQRRRHQQRLRQEQQQQQQQQLQGGGDTPAAPAPGITPPPDGDLDTEQRLALKAALMLRSVVRCREALAGAQEDACGAAWGTG